MWCSMPAWIPSSFKPKRRPGAAASSALLLLVAALTLPAHDPITTNLTWSKEISRVVFQHCAECHREGGRAFSLMTYEAARPWAKAIRDEVLNRRMPPWDAVKGVGEFRGDPSLSLPEMDLIVNWVEGGAPEGNPIYLPAMPKREESAEAAQRPGIELRESTTLDAPMTIAGIRPAGALEI